MRVVAVGKRIVWSARWRWFTDFLIDHLKNSLGRDWGADAQNRQLDHPIFRWLRRMGEIRSDSDSGDIQYEPIGFINGVLRLGYALYLIEHHDQLDESLVRRLRVPRSFQSAYYETLLAAAFAVSGFKIEMAEVRRQSARVPEFWATGLSGRRYAVEAKCKSAWKCPIDPDSREFKDELRQWLRDQLYKASSKRLQCPIYCFELSIGTLLSEDAWKCVQAVVRDTLVEAESITIAKEPAVPAYVIVTNHAHLVNDDARGIDQVAMLESFKLDTFRPGVEIPIEMAFEWRDEHRDVIWLMESMEEIERVPSTFDGRPPQFVAAERTGERFLKLGESYEIEFPDGHKLTGKVYDVVSHAASAHVVMETTDGEHRIAEIPLTPVEAEAARQYGDAVFGKPQKRQRKLDDIMELYDWFLEVYSKYDKDALLRQIPNHPESEGIGELNLEEMRVRVAREVTRAAYHHTEQSKQTPEGTAAEATP